MRRKRYREGLGLIGGCAPPQPRYCMHSHRRIRRPVRDACRREEREICFIVYETRCYATVYERVIRREILRGLDETRRRATKESYETKKFRPKAPPAATPSPDERPRTRRVIRFCAKTRRAPREDISSFDRSIRVKLAHDDDVKSRDEIPFPKTIASCSSADDRNDIFRRRASSKEIKALA